MTTKKQNKMNINSGETSINYKEILNRITGFQTHFRDLANVLSTYTSKSSIIRDKNDEVAKCLVKYRKIEGFNTTSKLAMSIVAELVGKVGDHQTTAIQRLETKVLPNLSSYGRICKCLKGDVRNAMVAEEKLLSRKKIVKAFEDRMTEEPKYRDVITDAERELENAMAESSRLGILSQEQVIKFEHKRLMDLKESLEVFFKIEIAKHAKSIELLTEAYKYIHSIDEDADLETLKRQLKLGEIQPMKVKNSKEDRCKSQKGKKTKKKEVKEAEESEDEETDKSWNSEIVKQLEKMLNSQLTRPSTAPLTKKAQKNKLKENKSISPNRKQSCSRSGNKDSTYFHLKNFLKGHHSNSHSDKKSDVKNLKKLIKSHKHYSSQAESCASDSELFMNKHSKSRSQFHKDPESRLALRQRSSSHSHQTTQNTERDKRRHRKHRPITGNYDLVEERQKEVRLNSSNKPEKKVQKVSFNNGNSGNRRQSLNDNKESSFTEISPPPSRQKSKRQFI